MKIGSFLDVDLTGIRNTLNTLSTLFGCVAGGVNTYNAQHCQRGLKSDLTALVFYCIIKTVGFVKGIGNQHAIA